MASGGWHGRPRIDLTPIQKMRKKIERAIRKSEGAYGVIVMQNHEETALLRAGFDMQHEGFRITLVRFTTEEMQSERVAHGHIMYHVNKQKG